MARTARPGRGWKTVASDSIPIPGDVEGAMEELGIKIYRVSDMEVAGWCPAHEERTGKQDKHSSWSVLREDKVDAAGNVVHAGTHNCFSCGFKGSFVSLVEYVLGVEVDDAENWVRERGGIERAKKTLRRRQEDANPLTVDTSKQINEASLALMVAPPAEKLAARNLDPYSALTYGVLWDTEKDCWIIPIRDPDTGKLWGWQEKNERFFKNYPIKINKSKTLFGLHQFEGNTAVLMESPLDVVRLHSAGVDGGLGSFGVQVSKVQMELVLDWAETLIVALDNDPDGDKISKQIQRQYSSRVRLRFLNYDAAPKAKDIGDMTDEQIHRAIETAVPSALMRFG